MRGNGHRIWEVLIWFRGLVSSWNIKEGLKNLFLRNRGKKILAVAFAVALWFSANIEQDVERSISAEVNYVGLPSDLVIMNEPPQTLSLRVRGPRTQLASLSSNRDIVFTLD